MNRDISVNRQQQARPSSARLHERTCRTGRRAELCAPYDRLGSVHPRLNASALSACRTSHHCARERSRTRRLVLSAAAPARCAVDRVEKRRICSSAKGEWFNSEPIPPDFFSIYLPHQGLSEKSLLATFRFPSGDSIADLIFAAMQASAPSAPSDEAPPSASDALSAPRRVAVPNGIGEEGTTNNRTTSVS